MLQINLTTQEVTETVDNRRQQGDPLPYADMSANIDFYYASVEKRVLLPIMYKVAYIGGVNNTDY